MSQSETHVSLWGGRFSGGPSQALAALSVSTHFDFRLAHVDIAGSHAHADELHRVGLLTDQECADMHDALARLDADVSSGAFVPSVDDEDVHTALERGLIERAGATLGGKLRAGRSRNDQIATLIRVYLREEARHLAGRILDIAQALLGQAVRAGDAVMPGRTHMQHAQPVLVAHHLMAHVWPLLRDVARLRDWDKRAAISPYGSGALAGNTLGMDPRRIAGALGFSDSVENSIDGTASRDVHHREGLRARGARSRALLPRNEEQCCSPAGLLSPEYPREERGSGYSSGPEEPGQCRSHAARSTPWSSCW